MEKTKAGYISIMGQGSKLNPDEIWGHFQLQVWSTFLNTSKLLLIYIILHTFSHLFLADYGILLNRTQGSSLFTWQIYQKTAVFFFSSSFLRTFFWVPITFECYHFQSQCYPESPTEAANKQPAVPHIP